MFGTFDVCAYNMLLTKLAIKLETFGKKAGSGQKAFNWIQTSIFIRNPSPLNLNKKKKSPNRNGI